MIHALVYWVIPGEKLSCTIKDRASLTKIDIADLHKSIRFSATVSDSSKNFVEITVQDRFKHDPGVFVGLLSKLAKSLAIEAFTYFASTANTKKADRISHDRWIALSSVRL